MLKKIVKTISIVAVLATAASAMDFCKTADNLFLQNGLEKMFFKFNNKQKMGAACEKNAGSAVCAGEMKAYEKLAANVYNTSGYENAITLLNKYGVKKQYNRTQIFINYNNFFLDYLKNKLKEMPEAKRKIFLEKMFLFFNRVPDEIIGYSDDQIKGITSNLYFIGIFNNPLKQIKDKKVAKAIIKQGVTAFIANKQLKGVNAVKGEAVLAFYSIANMQNALNANKQGYRSKDQQIGGSADNLEKFFVYAATKQYQKAFNLIDKTYSDQFIKEFNKEIKEVCNIK